VKDNKLRTDILEYLRTHPEAGDGLEGITRWWLVSQQVDLSVIAIKETLEELVTEGLIVERNIGDGRPVYFASNTGR
jgi:predicted ArsR family transcriptional regulator